MRRVCVIPLYMRPHTSHRYCPFFLKEEFGASPVPSKCGFIYGLLVLQKVHSFVPEAHTLFYKTSKIFTKLIMEMWIVRLVCFLNPNFS